MKELLIVANTPSANTARLLEAVVQGANHPEISGVTINCQLPLDATAEDVLRCNAIILGTTENFGYMSGLMKDFLERVYYPCLELKQGLPYSLYVRAGLDGTGTRTAVEKILTGLSWRAVHECVTLQGSYEPDFERQCTELGMHMAAGLDAGIF